MKSDFNVMLRLNNTIFKCAIDGDFYNVTDKQPYAVQIVGAIVLDPATRAPAVALDAAIICETCYTNEKYHLKEPSPIVVPTMDTKKVVDEVVGANGKPVQKAS